MRRVFSINNDNNNIMLSLFIENGYENLYLNGWMDESFANK